MNPKFYSLLYIDLDEKRQLQGRNHTREARLDIFIKNAALLDKSLKWHGYEGLTLLTNDEQKISEACKRTDCELNYETIDFSLPVPKGIPFYSAHYKIDAFKYFSSRPDDEYSILMDNDIVMLHQWPDAMTELIETKMPTCYILKFGNDVDRAVYDCRRSCSEVPVMQWTGGEFWGGGKYLVFRDVLQMQSGVA